MSSHEGGIIENLAERIEQRVAEQPFQRDEVFLERILRLMEIFNGYFDAEVTNLDRLPESGPMLLVGNHSGGALVPDTTATLAGWYRERGLDDPLLGLAFDGMFAVPWVEDLMRKIGEIPASHENAAKAFDSGASLLFSHSVRSSSKHSRASCSRPARCRSVAFLLSNAAVSELRCSSSLKISKELF